MEVVSGNAGLLTNIEVLELLRGRIEAGKNSEGGSSISELIHRDRIQSQTSKFISESAVGSYSSEQVRTCLSELKKLQYNFTEAELVQIANLVPLHAVELHLILEECAERLTDDQVEHVLSVVQTTFGVSPAGAEE